MKIYSIGVRGIYKSGKDLCMDGFNFFSYNTSVHIYNRSLTPDILNHIKRNIC